MGQIADEFTYEHLDSVTVRFLRPDSTEVERIVSRDDRMNDRSFGDYISAPGKYILHFSKRGYEDTYKTVNFRYRKYRITGGTFGRVLMKKQQTLTEHSLHEAVVTATRIKMVMKGDTIQYNADAFQQRTGSMLDQLNRMSSRSYSLDAQMQTESYRNVLRRYVMFNLSFRLREVL